VSDLIALIDLGSNAVRFTLAEVTPGREPRVVHSERVQTRLGGGRAGRLPRQAIDHTVESVHRFLRRARNGREVQVRAFATAAVRDAPNRDRLLGALRRREGIDVTVLSSAEEARLGVAAALRSLAVRRGLVADLGGGSVQLSRVSAGRIVSTGSVPLGAVRLTRRFLRHDPPLPGEMGALVREVRAQLAHELRPRQPGDEMVGLGGTIRTLAKIHFQQGGDERHGSRLPRAAVAAMRERLAALSLPKRRRVPGLKSERADIIVAGAVVVEEIMTTAGYSALTVCIHGVRDGFLLEEVVPGARRP
jgi:exopolyphosphatase / guanosine-5'-triphosphate,3'-diphosphate pyrophosphatase